MDPYNTTMFAKFMILIEIESSYILYQDFLHFGLLQFNLSIKGSRPDPIEIKTIQYRKVLIQHFH